MPRIGIGLGIRFRTSEPDPFAGFETEAIDYITACGLSGVNALAIDDTVKMLKGKHCSTSLRGTVWTVLSANRWTNLKAFYPFASNYNIGSGTTVKDLRGLLDLTITGGMAWGASAFTFDGTNDLLSAASPAVTSGQWSCMTVGQSAGAVSRIIVSQSNATTPENYRNTFMSVNSLGYWGMFKRVDPTSYSVSSLVTATAKRSMLSYQNATHLRMAKDGNSSVLAETALAPTTISSTPLTIGGPSSPAGTVMYQGSLQLTALWGENVSGDYPEIHSNLNSILGLGL